MRWLFLLLLVLNVFYCVWHQQQAPLRVKEILPLSAYRTHQQDIRLLSESREQERCMFLGGLGRPDLLQALRQRLLSLDVQSEIRPALGGDHWLRVEPESRRLMDDALLAKLAHDFPQIKNKIMSCEGIATGG